MYRIPAQVETYDENSRQYIVDDALGMTWSSQYGVSGGGFGFLRFSLSRDVGHDYQDIGYGYRIVVRKYLTKVLFVGRIVRIEESTDRGTDTIQISCLGMVSVTTDEELYHVFCDTNLNRWIMESEVAAGSFHPERFVTNIGDLGMLLHPKNNEDIDADDYTERVYTFKGDESAQRFKADLSMSGGSGTIFDATVSSVAGANVVYANDSGEGSLAADMIVYNWSQGQYATIQSINTGTNTITFTSSADVSSWLNGDEIAAYGPLFFAEISDITAAVLTYAGNIIGESNLSASQTICNVTKKSMATIQSYDAVANTITVTDENHLTGWQVGDAIFVAAPYFSAIFVSAATATITYSSPIGERVAAQATGWVLYNVTRDDYATVQSWTIASNQVVVTDSADISGWAASDVLRIFTPFRIEILDSSDTTIWPASDWRQGAIFRNRTSINVTTSGSPAGLKIRMKGYISGAATESTFAMLENVKIYSTQNAVTASELTTYAIGVLSGSGFGLSSSTAEVESVSKVLEPMLFEFETVDKAMEWACRYGDGAGSLLAWGVRPDENDRIYLETQDPTSETSYVVRKGTPMKASLEGDLQESWQQVRGVYADKLGEQQITDWLTEPGSYWMSTHYRRRSVRVENVDTDAEAQELVQLFLDENKDPKTGASYSVEEGSVFDVNGLPVPVDEMLATGMSVQIEGWNAVEAGSGGVFLESGFTSEQLVGVEVNYDEGTARLIPATARSSFEEYLSELARIAR